MTDVDTIEKLSEAIGERIRKVTGPGLFTIFRRAHASLDFLAIDQQLDAIGYGSAEQVYEADEAGHVVGLFLVLEGLPEGVLMSLQSLSHLTLLGLQVRLAEAVPAARAIASLPELRHLTMSLSEGDNAEALLHLSKAPRLEALVLETETTIDVSPLRTLSTLTTLAVFATHDVVTNLESLAECRSLHHLALPASSLPRAGQLLRLGQLKTLLLESGAANVDLSPLTSLRGLRRLVAENLEVPPEVLRELRELRSLKMSYPLETLEPVIALPHLEELELGETNLADLSAVQRFPRLRHLSIAEGKTTDISHLRGLESLTFLDISKNPVEKLPAQLAMPNLRHLAWKGGGKHRLDCGDLLSSCQALEILDLSDHVLGDLGFLRPLGNLVSINVSDNRLTEIAPLADLPKLAIIDVSGNRVRSLAPLAQNTAITHLEASGNPIEDVAALAGLYRLEDLKLRDAGITDLAFAKRLRNLYALDVGKNRIGALEPLLELSYLARVDLSGNRIRRVTAETIAALRSLDTLTLQGNPIEALDPELLTGDGKKVLKSLRDYFLGLSRGRVKHDQVKLLLVGNGRVGKTSIVNRLIDGVYDPDQPSTHGIQLRRWRLEHVADDKLAGQPVQVNVWDFGGQDIYHATHRLFMRTRALFLLVWDRQTESEAYSLDEFGERYENFRLPYWIDYIKALSGSPVLIVQNKVDGWQDKQAGYGQDLQRTYPPPGGIVDYFYVSAQKPDQNGMPTLVEAVKDAIGRLEAIGFGLPVQWVEVRDRLAAMDRPYLDYGEFVTLCASVGMLGAEHTSLAGFLHQAGAIFHDPRSFGERIILDQKWAIDAVYALFDRRGAAYRDLRMAGRNGLTLDLLKHKVWRHFSEDEHQLLLEFMRTCELCFEFGQGRYYVPQLLPDDKPSRVEVRWPERTPFCLQIVYGFLHRAIIDQFLVRAGSLGADYEPEIWRNGIVIYDAATASEAMVEAFPGENRILVQARGNGAVPLLRMIRREFDRLHDTFPAAVSCSADGGRRFVDAASLQQHVLAGAHQVLSTAGELTEVAPLREFLVSDETRVSRGGLQPFTRRGSLRAPSRPEMFLSYAWGDAGEPGESRETIVDQLYDALVARGHRVVRDKHDSGYRGVISEFMQRLGKGKLIVAVISDKYLRSPYCMFELLEIHQNGQLRDRLFPIVLPDAKLYTLSDRLAYVRHWQREKEKVETLIKEIGLAAFSSEGTFKEYDRCYRQVFNNIDTLLTLLADWNSLTPQVLEEHSFDRLVTALEAQVATA